MLVALMALMGMSTAWAQTSTLLEYGTADVAWTADNLAEWTAGGNPTITDGYVSISGSNGSYATSKTIAPTANAIINVQAVWRGASATGRDFSKGNGSYFRFGNIIVAQNDQNKKHGYGFAGLSNIASVTTFTAGSYRTDIANCTWLLIEMEINTASNTVTSFTIKSEDGNTTYASASDVVLADADYTTVAFGYQKTSSVSTTNVEQLKSVKVTQTAQAVETTDYTVKYVCNGVEVKEAATRTGVVGQNIVLTDADMQNFYSSDNSKKYIYVSNDAEGKTVAEGAVVTVTFREAAKYAWTAKSNVGTYTTSGETFEGDQASANYPLYQLVDGILWTKAATNQIFAVNFDVTENNYEYTIVYTETETPAVFYAEVEDIEGMTAYAAGNAAARSSQRAAGYSASGNTLVTTLPQGKYKIFARFYSPTSAGGKYNFYTGNRNIWEATTGNANATDLNTEVVLAKESNEIFLGQGGYTQAVDFIYIQSLGEPTAEELAAAQAADTAADEAAAAAEALAAAKADLQAAITEAKAIDTTDKEGVDELNAAITAAESALNAEDATVESLNAAKSALAIAIEAFNAANTITPSYGEIWSGTKAFPVEEYESMKLNTGYFKDFVQAGDVIKVTLQPAAEEARAEAPMRDIKRFGELALLAADESIIAENGEIALDTEEYSFTVEESWIEKLSTGNNIYLRGRNLTVTKIELLEAVFEPVDCTAKVSTEDWLSEQGSVGGPVTLGGIAQKEQYNGSTTAIIQGDVLYQVVEGLDNGTYRVELYANASFTSGRNFTSDIIDGELGRVVVYAGDVDKTIPVFDQGWVNTNNIVTLENVVVSDGTLRMGLKKIAPGTNWHTIQIKSLTQVSNKAEADADAQDTYWKGIAATVAAYEAYANVAGSEKAAIVAAETKAAAQAAIPPFYAAKPGYDALADIIAKANSADYDVTEAEALMASTETTAEQAAAKAAELLHPVTLAVNTKAVEGASKDNPIETNFVVNGTFDTEGVIAPWKSTTGAQNQKTANNQHGAFGVENSFFFENWNSDPFTGKMYQEIEDIPNGLYTLKICAFVNNFDATAQYVYANTDQTPLTTGTPTAYEVQTNVTTNTIEIGLEQIVAVANWMGVDNVSLIYKGDGTATSINEVTAKQNTGNAIYNLQGQKVQNARKGLYIINGKKVMK